MFEDLVPTLPELFKAVITRPLSKEIESHLVLTILPFLCIDHIPDRRNPKIGELSEGGYLEVAKTRAPHLLVFRTIIPARSSVV
jgi:hypothetical protein